MGSGYIKIYRDFLNKKEWLSEPFTKSQAWIDLINLANYRDSFFYIRGNKVEVKRGFVARSQESLSERWKWSRGKTRLFLRALESSHQIIQQKSQLINLILIVNYEEYQSQEPTEKPLNCTTESQQKANRKPYKNKNKKNKHEKIKDIYIDFSESFLKRWKIYPKKSGKKNAFIHWKKFCDDESLLKKFDKALDNYLDELSRNRERQPKDGQGFFNPDYWLGWDEQEATETLEEKMLREDRENGHV